MTYHSIFLSMLCLSRLTVLVTLALSVVFGNSVQAQSWSVLSKQNPNPRAAADAVEIDDKFYVVGGLQPNTALEEKRIDVFDPYSNSWNTVVPQGSLTPGFGGMTWHYDGKIYRYNQMSVLIYDPTLNQWDAPAMGGEQPAIPPTAYPVVAGSRVYFIGGEISSEKYDIYYLEMNDLTWGQIKTTGDQASGSQPFGWGQNDRLYVFQGIAKERTSDVSILNLKTNTWSRHQTGAGPFYFNSAAEHEGKVILLAHIGVDGETLKTFIFDPQDHSLKELTLLRQIDHASSSGLFNLGGVLYSVGQVYDKNGIFASDTVSIEALSMPQSVVASETALQINIYPNPVHSELRLNAAGRVSSIEILDMVGRRISIESVEPVINVSMLPAGVYRLTCEVDGRRISRSFVKR